MHLENFLEDITLNIADTQYMSLDGDNDHAVSHTTVHTTGSAYSKLYLKPTNQMLRNWIKTLTTKKISRE